MIPTHPRGCLAVIFNHYYAGNIEKLARIYAGRFAHIIYLVPNVRLDRPDCITIYRGPFTFQGYVADAAARLAALDVDYFVFTADDLILNPADDETTLFGRLGLDSAQGFLPFPEPFAGEVRQWDWWKRVAWRLRRPRDQLLGSGVEQAFTHLPGRAAAEAKFKALGFADPRIMIIGETGLHIMFNAALPLVKGVSDMFAIRRDAFAEFAHFCGVLASLDLFVEVAIPTALMLACDRLQTLRTMGLKMNWSFTPLVRGRKEQRGSLEPILRSFGPKLLFIHPVKLSALELDDPAAP